MCIPILYRESTNNQTTTKTMKTTCTLLALTALIATGAETGTEKPEMKRRPPVPLLFAVLNTERDNVISAEEITAASESLAKLDRNEDGTLTPREYLPKLKKGIRPPKFRPSPILVKSLDTDKDRVISAEELAAAPESLLALDKNEDGQLSREDLHLPMPPKESAE